MSMSRKSNSKFIGFLLFIVVVVASVAIYFGMIRHRAVSLADVKIDGVILKEARSDIAPFNLQDTTGNPFTRDSLKGHWTMMFFGFTNCGMVCPATMAAMNGMYKKLESVLPADQMPTVVLITVDPERDDMNRLKGYVNSFNPHFIGARADINETVALEKQLHIAAAKIQADGAGKNHYTINHSAEVLLFNPDGNLQAFFSYPHTPEKLTHDYRAILDATNATV
ncbi:MAG: SCO family protein [Gammaproteobacteria bacterium]|nr:SCO family protein [Gammaproteobacteria bacterium]